VRFQTAFFRQHGCTTSDAPQKYNSRAAAMYREKLHSMALRAMQVHGTKVRGRSHGGGAWDSVCMGRVVLRVLKYRGRMRRAVLLKSRFVVGFEAEMVLLCHIA
jgi:hypothetical protein